MTQNHIYVTAVFFPSSVAPDDAHLKADVSFSRMCKNLPCNTFYFRPGNLLLEVVVEFHPDLWDATWRLPPIFHNDVFLQWDTPGQLVGPNNSYVTSTNIRHPKFAAWASQFNVTYSRLLNVSIRDKTAYTIQPNVSTWAGDPMINGTMFMALTDADPYVTPYNLTMLNPHTAALAVYQAG